MNNLTIVIPFWNGNNVINRLLSSLPDDVPVVIVQDANSERIQLEGNSDNVRVIELSKRGYFSGAVNVGVESCDTDVLVLNQDVWFEGNEWQDVIRANREHYAIYGEGVLRHPAWPSGYVQGTFMFIRRDAWRKVGKLNERDYPLWGCTAEWQLRACRMGYKALPLAHIPGMYHEERKDSEFGASITQAIKSEWDKRWLFVRTPPAISVVVPLFNYGRYLPDAIESLMAQTFKSFEVIIVDDASTDTSATIAQGFADDFKAIHVIKRKQNGGTAACLNSGVEKAHGWFVTVLSADDMYHPDRLETFWRAGVENPNAVFYDDIVWRTPKGDTIKKMHPYNFDNVEWSATEPPGLLSRNCMHAGIMFPRKAWAEVGGYPEEFNDGREDWAFNIALGQAGYCGVHIEQPLYIYRREKQNRSMRNTTPVDHARFVGKLMARFPELYEGVYPMGCCGGRRSKSKSRTTPPAPAATKAAALPTDKAILVYTGKNFGREPYTINGRTYKAGLLPRYRRIAVHPDDVSGLLATKSFKVVSQPVVVQPVKVAQVEQVAVVEDAQLDFEEVAEEDTFILEISDEEDNIALPDNNDFDTEVNATNGAKKYAREIGLDLLEHPRAETGERITKFDVEKYAHETGLL